MSKKKPIIALNMSKYRKYKTGMTQQDLADKIGVKRSLVGSYEEGRAKVPSDRIHLVADALGLTLDQLCREEILV